MTICDQRHRQDEPAVASVQVVVDGERRSIDLCSEHLSEFKKMIRAWGAGRRTTGGSVSKGATRNPDAAAIRAWAVEHGYTVPQRGRIPGAVIEAYRGEAKPRARKKAPAKKAAAVS